MVNIITDLYDINNNDIVLKNTIFQQVKELANSIPDHNRKLRIVIGIKKISLYR